MRPIKLINSISYFVPLVMLSWITTESQFLTITFQLFSCSSCAWRLCGDNFVASFPALRIRRHVLFFVVFVPVQAKVVKEHSTTTKSSGGSCVWRWYGVNFVASIPTLRIRGRVLFFVVFVQVTFKFVPLFVCLGIANIGLAYS